MKNEEGNKVPDPNSPRGLKFEINIDKDNAEYEVFDFNTKERKSKKVLISVKVLFCLLINQN